MGYQPIEELLPKSGYSIYKLVRLAAVRAIQLADGSPKLLHDVAADTKTPTIALDEIRAGKVVIKSVAAEFAPPKSSKKEKKAAASEASEGGEDEAKTKEEKVNAV